MKKIINHKTIKPFFILLYSLFGTQYVFCEDSLEYDNKKTNKIIGWSMIIIVIIIIYYSSATGGGDNSLILETITSTPVKKMFETENKDNPHILTYLEVLSFITGN